MTVHSIKTDNADPNKKISLRRQATAHIDQVKVLDLFAGNNILWSSFKCARYFGVEKEKGKGRNLNAENLRVISSLDLSGFNVIDLDSYGVPFNQMFKLFENKTLADGTMIIYTCISNSMSGMNKKCLEMFGFESMYKKVKVLINSKSCELFFAYLFNIGVKEVFEYTDHNSFFKHYGYFVFKKS